MIELRSPYPGVLADGLCSYGGSQMWSASVNMRQCGCGIIAAYDLVRYLKSGPDAKPMPLDDYNQRLRELNRRYFPLIPRFGINGILLVFGLNRLLRKEGLPYRAKWMASGSLLWDRVTQMLLRDIPVILSVGPNFPAIWQKHSLDFYIKTRDGRYRKAAAISAHYVTATGIDEEWVRISSWGRMYFVNRREYADFVRKHSNYLFSNIVSVEKI